MQCIPGTPLVYNKTWLQKITRELDNVSEGAFSRLDSKAQEPLIFERFLLSSTANSLVPETWKSITNRLSQDENLQLLGDGSSTIDLLTLEEKADTIRKSFCSIRLTVPIIVEIASCIPCYLLGTVLQTVEDPSLFVFVGSIRTRMLLRLKGVGRKGGLNTAFLVIGAKIYIKECNINCFQAQTIFQRRPKCSWLDVSLDNCILMGGYNHYKVMSLVKNKAIMSLLIDEHLLQINMLVRRCKRNLKKGKVGSVATYQEIKKIAFQENISFHPVHITLDEFLNQLTTKTIIPFESSSSTESTYIASSYSDT